jgi:predicted neuraminidase
MTGAWRRERAKYQETRKTKFIVMNNCVCGISAVAFALFFLSCSPKPETSDGEEEDTVLTLKRDFIFGDDRLFPQCHASTLLRAADGKFIVAWFGGTHEKNDDVGIWLSRGMPGNWTAPKEVAKIRQDPHWNPVLFRKPSGEIILYFKVGKIIDAWETWFMTSTDNGQTWSVPRELVPGDKGGRGPVRNKPIILSNGTWLAPASNEKDGVWNAFIERSEDGGTTWRSTPFLELNRDSVPNEGVIQPTLWESENGKVHMLLRSSAGLICRSDSKDFGKTWTPVYRTKIPNPNSGIDITKTAAGRLVLIFNPDSINWGARKPISCITSSDNGKSWSDVIDLETGMEGDEFSYPSVISFDDTVAVTYTWKRQKIAFWMGRIER